MVLKMGLGGGSPIKAISLVIVFAFWAGMTESYLLQIINCEFNLNIA